MSRDDEAEGIVIETSINYEISYGQLSKDVSANNEGYDIRIEVKGRSGSDGSVMLWENEMNCLAQLVDTP